MTQFDASGFDDDLEDIAGQAKAEDAGPGFNRHPRGKFQGVIEEVKAKTGKQGQPLWEFMVATAEGQGQYTMWGWKPGEVAQAKAKASSGNVEDLQRVQAAMARHKRLFVDLGLAEPETWAKGENSILGRMGELIGRPCTLVVQADNRDATKDRVFINAPAADAGDQPTATGLDAPDFGGGGTPGLEDIPFMRRLDL